MGMSSRSCNYDSREYHAAAAWMLRINAHSIAARTIRAALLLGVMLVTSTAQAATLTVTSLGDGAGNANDNLCTLREAANAINSGADDANDCSNGSPDAYGTNDTIDAMGINGDIMLSVHVQLAKSVIVNGSGASNLSIHGDNIGPGVDRIFFVASTASSVTLNGLTLTDGKTIDDSNPATSEAGGALYSQSTGLLALKNCIVTGNTTEGDNSDGGGLYTAGSLSLTDSTVSDNSTKGEDSSGGGLYVGMSISAIGSTVAGNSTMQDGSPGGGLAVLNKITLTDSTVTDNSTAGKNSDGGGMIAAGPIKLTNSTVSTNNTAGDGSAGGGLSTLATIELLSSRVSDNGTTGDNASGGGMYALSSITVTDSSIFHNSTAGKQSAGGGMYAAGAIMLTDSTVSGNETTGDSSWGGGINSGSDISLSNSTVSGNQTTGPNTKVGGLAGFGNITLIHSTIAYNKSVGSPVAGVFVLDGTKTFTAQNTLIVQQAGQGACGSAFDAGSTNNIVANPGGDDVSCGADNPPTLILATLGEMKLGPLADNGGLTQTHALFKDSAALDSADLTVCNSAPASGLDQRGLPRPKDGDGNSVNQCDIGSFEAQGVPPIMPSGGGGSSSGSGGCALSGYGNNSLGWLGLLLGGGLWWRWRRA